LRGAESTAPYSAAIAAIVVTGITADRTRARRMHFSLAMVWGAIGLSASVFVRINPALAIIFLYLSWERGHSLGRFAILGNSDCLSSRSIGCRWYRLEQFGRQSCWVLISLHGWLA
jgi:hypothetical protein